MFPEIRLAGDILNCALIPGRADGFSHLPDR